MLTQLINLVYHNSLLPWSRLRNPAGCDEEWTSRDSSLYGHDPTEPGWTSRWLSVNHWRGSQESHLLSGMSSISLGYIVCKASSNCSNSPRSYIAPLLTARETNCIIQVGTPVPVVTMWIRMLSRSQSEIVWSCPHWILISFTFWTWRLIHVSPKLSKQSMAMCSRVTMSRPPIRRIVWPMEILWYRLWAMPMAMPRVILYCSMPISIAWAPGPRAIERPCVDMTSGISPTTMSWYQASGEHPTSGDGVYYKRLIKLKFKYLPSSNSIVVGKRKTWRI